MRKTLTAATLAAALSVSGIAFAQPASSQPGGGARFSDIAARLEGQGWLIHEMELKREGIEVKVTDRDGRRVRLLLDAASGQVLRQEERSRRDGGR
jgi:hypothetical protein